MWHQIPTKILKENGIPVNPEILRAAREGLGFSRRCVVWWSKRLEKCCYAPITAWQLRDWEEGLGWPDLEHLETLAEIYDCPIGLFLLPEFPEKWQKIFRWRKILPLGSIGPIAKLLWTILTLKIARMLDKLRDYGPLDADEEEEN